MGLTMRGKPTRSAAAQTSATVRAATCQGVRRPAASSSCFIRSLSRNGTVCSTVSPGRPSSSRSRAASTMYGSHRHSTWSMRMCLAISRTSPITWSSAASEAVCT